MKKLLLLFLSVFLCFSCSQKVYFFGADKLHDDVANHNSNIYVDGFFAGDALDYIVFELDVKNESNDTIRFSFNDVYLKVYDPKNSLPLELSALNKNQVIEELNLAKVKLDREKKGRDIGNAINFGLNVIAIGSGNRLNGLDLALYSAETAAFMLEDSRSHKLLKGSLEEQIAYVDDWVLYNEALAPGNENSWDVLFERNLYNAEADLVIEINGITYAIPFVIKTIEQKVR